MNESMRAFLVYVAIATPLAILLFLFSSAFFTSWDGHVISRRPSPEGATAVEVLIVTDQHDSLVTDWPLDLVTELDLPADPYLIAPPRVAEDAIATAKSAFSLSYTVTTTDGERVLPTTSPRALYLAVLAWLLGLAVRNMVVSGSPLVLERRETHLPESMPASGAPVPPAGADAAQGRAVKGRQGPPPPRPRRGAGRR